MSLAGTAAITELWAKCKAWFGTKVTASTTATTVSIQLKNTNNDNLGSAATIPAATTSAAGVMTADDKTKMNTLPTFGSSTTTFLANNGTWLTPAGTAYSDFTGATDSAAGAHGLVPAPAIHFDEYILQGSGSWVTLAVALKAYLSSRAIDQSGILRYDSSYDGSILPNDDHASTTTSYGTGTNTKYGHLKLSDATNGTAAAASGATAATPKAVSDALTAAKNYADSLIVGGSAFQGQVNSNTTISSSDYKAGWSWVVGTAGTYVGQTCEVGDMVYAINTKSGSYSASDFTVVQNNIVEMTTQEVDAICV